MPYMPFIDTENTLPGIRGLMTYRPETGRILSELAQEMLRGPSPLSPAEREMIAVRVSRGNCCVFCENSHAGAARVLLADEGEDPGVVQRVADHGSEAAPDARMAALLKIADFVRVMGRTGMEELVEEAREAGADDIAIHDTVLIASAFCMFNRYVDGLGATTPEPGKVYEEMGEMLAKQGYVR